MASAVKPPLVAGDRRHIGPQLREYDGDAAQEELKFAAHPATATPATVRTSPGGPSPTEHEERELR